MHLIHSNVFQLRALQQLHTRCYTRSQKLCYTPTSQSSLKLVFCQISLRKNYARFNSA